MFGQKYPCAKCGVYSEKARSSFHATTWLTPLKLLESGRDKETVYESYLEAQEVRWSETLF